MTKKDKTKYITETLERFEDAHNHGNNGINWWYPKPFVIAYDVKMRSFGSIEDLRKHLTKKQNEYYDDEQLLSEIYHEQEMTAELLIEDIKETFDLKANFAGRSGGWLEVDYSTIEHVSVDENDSMSDVNYAYILAKALDTLETKVSAYIENAHKAYNAYVDSEDYYKDLAENLSGDEWIDDEYQDQINTLQGKINGK